MMLVNGETLTKALEAMGLDNARFFADSLTLGMMLSTKDPKYALLLIKVYERWILQHYGFSMDIEGKLGAIDESKN